MQVGQCEESQERESQKKDQRREKKERVREERRDMWGEKVEKSRNVRWFLRWSVVKVEK